MNYQLVIFLYGAVNDHPNGASDDRRNGAISKWPKSSSQTDSKRLFFTPFHFADLVVF
jgi:hypothetical protein